MFPRLSTRQGIGLASLLLVAITVVAYGPTFHGPFLLDDVGEIEHNPALSTLWPPQIAMFAGGRLPHRPLAYYSFAVNRAVGGTDPVGYRAVNLLVHVLNGLLLGWLTTRAGCRVGGDRAGPLAAWVGCCVAGIWLVHPLAIQPVAYIYQRMEILAATSILATLACFEKSLTSKRPAAWLAGAVVACALGMGCKETAVVAPLLVALYQVLIVAGALPAGLAAVRRRAGFFLALASCWLLLAAIVVAQRQRYSELREAGSWSALDGAVDAVLLPPWRYLLEQSQVIPHYVRLAAWPAGLCFDHGWQPAGSVMHLILPSLVMAALLAAGLAAISLLPAAAFLILSFFLLLAPTSSVSPVADLCVEHRMYLPLAVLVAGVIGGLAAGLSRLGTRETTAVRLVALTGVVVLGLAATTHARSEVYRSRLALWNDTVAKAPRNPRAWVCLGRALLDAGDSPAAERVIAEALRLRPGYADALAQMGNAVRERDLAAATALYRQAVEADPGHLAARTNLAAMLGMRGDPEAEGHLRMVLAADAWNVEALSNYGNLCMSRGDTRAAREWFARAAALAPGDPIVRRNLEIVTAAEAARKQGNTP